MDLQKGLQESKSAAGKKTGFFNSFFKKTKKIADEELNEETRKKPFFKSSNQIPESGDLEISLMPEKTMIIPRIIHSRSLLLIAAIIVIINIFSISWLYFDWHFEKIKDEVEKTKREMQLVEAQSISLLDVKDEIAVLEKNANRAESILNNHIYWTKFFGLLEKYTTADVFFKDFSADTSGIIHLNSVGRDLISLAKQFVVFSQASDFVKEVNISDVVNMPKGVKATFTLVLANGVFKRWNIVTKMAIKINVSMLKC